MDVVGRILEVARRNAVHAILCAGDIFDDPSPETDFWQGLLKVFRAYHGPYPPLFLVPGNHDPLAPESIWHNRQFRAELPAWVHVVDQDDFTYELSPSAVLYARPCRSKAGETDLAMALPARAPGDERLRIGCVHGSTFDIEGHQTNFPISRNAGTERGLDYLAIGDTHSFRDVTASSPVPTVYPGSPEPTSFDEKDAGHVALVAMFRRGIRPRVEKEPVAFWRWRHQHCRSMSELHELLTMADLERHVIRVHLEMSVSLAEQNEVERILRDLRGTDATHGRSGILLENRAGLRLRADTTGAFPPDLPPVLKDTVARLEQLSQSGDEAGKARAARALAHLYTLLQTSEVKGSSV